MIHVTRLDHKAIVVNAELIVTIESTPDTLVTLSSGLQFVVRESVGDVVSRVVEYRRQLLGTLKVVTATSDRTVREEG
jgi:flagellar protein FlbD